MDKVSINFYSLIRDGKKSIFDILINDLLKFCDFGEIYEVKMNCNITNNIENFRICHCGALKFWGDKKACRR